MSAKKFVPPSQHVVIIENGKRVGTMSVGGPILLIRCGKRDVAFEMHDYIGPTPVNKRTYEVLTREPPGFLDAYEAWVRNGKLVNGNRCIT